MGTKMFDLEQKIRERAYQLWELEGRIHGRHDEHWHLAKLELTSAVETSAPVIEAPAAVVSAEPAKKKGRRSAQEPAVPVAAAAPRRRRTSATLQ
jgi:hypothetical protein